MFTREARLRPRPWPNNRSDTNVSHRRFAQFVISFLFQISSGFPMFFWGETEAIEKLFRILKMAFKRIMNLSGKKYCHAPACIGFESEI
jgi:hypothetical protein